MTYSSERPIPQIYPDSADIGMADALALQSMYIFGRRASAEVSHQDGTFPYTDPLTVTGFWFVVEDATIDNGCLGRPRRPQAPLRKVFRRGI